MTEQKSLLYKLEPIIKRWPAVTKPEGHVHFRTKAIWTLVVLTAYFMLGNVLMYGLSQDSVDLFAQFRAILAGQSGSIIHLGIGPIVTGGIILQLFTGAKIVNLDLKDPEDKAIYQGTQKLLIFLMLFVEGTPQVFGFVPPSEALIGSVGLGWARTVIAVQLALGGYLIWLMDEVVSKWGVGSGVSLFIVAGIGQGIFTGLFSWVPTVPTLPTDVANPPGGLIPKTIYFFDNLSMAELRSLGFEEIAFTGQNSLIALASTVIIFLVVSYVESSRIELPLAHARVRGARGRYPIRLMYANVLPLIFVRALQANINLLAIVLWSGPLRNLPLIGNKEWVGSFPLIGQGDTSPYTGLAYYLNNPSGLQSWLLPIIDPDRYGQVLLFREEWQIWVHVLVWATFTIVGSIIFAIFWVETASMGPSDVAKNIQSSGMQLPGFRRDPRVLERVLARYIPTVTVISGAALGILAVFADLFGTLGQAGGTGLLLTVGILSRLYEQIAKEQMMEMHPMIRGLFGEA